MRTSLRLTTTCAGSDRVLDVAVECDAGDTAADLAEALGGVWPERAGGGGLLVDGMPVGADALVGHPPLLDGACVRLGTPAVAPRGRPRPAPAVLRLDVVAGPDAGRSHPLTPGRHVVGRDASCDVSVDDPGLSRRQLAVEVSADGLRVEDLGSTNGTLLAGRPVGREPLSPGAELQVGGSRLVVRPATDAAPAARTAPGDGTWTVHRSPALAGPPPAVTLELLRPPLAPSPVRIPWLGMLLPLPVCALLAFLWGPQLLAFALLGPLVSGGTAVADRRAGRRRHAAEETAYRRRRTDVEASLAAALGAERAGLHALHPDAATTARTARGPTRRLWERGPGDPLAVRVGLGDVGSATVVVDPETHRPVAQRLTDAPVVLDLRAAGVTGLCGPAKDRYAVGRHVLGQLAVLHSPADVRLLVLDADDALAWTRWLPHSEPVCSVEAALSSLVGRLDDTAARQSPGGRTGGRDGAFTVVVLPPASRLPDDGAVEALLAHARAGACGVVALADSAADLPPQCRAVLDLGASGTTAPATLERAGEPAVRVLADGVSRSWAERVARSLAPLRDPRGGVASLPVAVGLEEAAGTDLSDDAALRRAWSGAGAGLDAVVGRRADGPHVVDLVRDGPHALLGGTTGSGKSELLRALVAGIAARHSPEAVGFVLVDYKGGAAFRECAALPHTAALVTDLDPHLARRALTGLTAELHRREALLAARGARDLDELNADPGPAGRVPRLVIVVDELKMLVEQLPEFVEGLVRLAALGRSLGLHLVLATQRPAGAVTADVQANVNLRIALRVRDRVDSEHVLAAPDAALLPDDVPGRAVMSSGSGPLVTFQVAHPGAVARAVRGVRVRPLYAPVAPAADDGPSDLARLVDTARRVAAASGYAPPRAPWLTPLPTVLPTSGLSAVPGSVALGLVDDPARQAQDVWTWSPLRTGVLGVVGASGSGRTTLVRTLVAGLIGLGVADVPETHVHVVDAGRALSGLAGLPHVGAVVDPADVARLGSLVARLTEELARRSRLLASHGLTRLEELPARPTVAPPPWLLLVVDGWDLLADAATADHDLLGTVDRLRSVIEEGRAVGLRAVVTGGRSLLLGSPARMCTSRLVLGRLDPAEAALAGLPRQDGGERPPGRGILLEEGLEVQVAHLGADASGKGQSEALLAAGAIAARGWGGPVTAPFRVGSLPAAVCLDDLPDGPGLLVGLGEDGEPVGIRPDEDGRRILVAGPRRSGRTTALSTLAARCVAAGLTTTLVTVRAADHVSPDVTRLGPHEVERLVAAHRADPHLAVLVDDAEQLAGSPMDVALTELAARVERDGGLLVCTADSAVAATLFRGVVAEVGRARTGLLLDPSGPLDGDVLGIRVPRARTRHAGRGLLVVRGAVTPVQVARPTEQQQPIATVREPREPRETRVPA